jgi:arylsulfatase A-like enzyme
MEVYAGFLEHTDHHLGRLVDALADLEVLGDTLVYYIIGDNGASAESTINGTFNELISLNGAAALETPEFMAARIDQFGTPQAYNHYAVGWAHAMDTPYQWTKQVASHWGGTRNGTIVHWPGGIQAKGELRSQFHHSTPWAFGAELPAFDDDVWELYGPDDWTQARNLATEQPDKLAELQRLFLLEASKYNVFPLDDRRVERFNPDLAGPAGAGMLNAERSFRRLKGYRQLPTLVAALARHVQAVPPACDAARVA